MKIFLKNTFGKHSLPVVEQTNPAHSLTAGRAHGFLPQRLSFGKIVAWLLLIGMSFLFVVPFLWMISTALKDPRDVGDGNWIPQEIKWNNFVDAFSFGDWGTWATNSLVISLVAVVGTVLSTSLVAYSFARLRWPGRDLVFSLVLATMMLPGIVTMIPSFILFSKLPAFGFQDSQSWVNTFLPLTVPAFTGNAFYIFLTRQFMRGIPMELSEAARIDGASELRIWARIVMPLTKPALAAVAIFAFQGSWEDFMGPLLYLQSEDKYTLQLALRQFENASGGLPNWAHMMAASLVVMLPVIIIFLLFQRFFIEGVTLTGMGGR
ncbi:MAG TPA: carbohydrate ABC transporter permease [Chloroflexia bacterium]|nr:carbohydrate ABC transporter permease [Chloroflexia bacterium]